MRLSVSPLENFHSYGENNSQTSDFAAAISNKFLNFYFRHIGVIETATEAAVYRHTWWLVVAGMTGVKEQFWACRRKSDRIRMPSGQNGVVNLFLYLVES